MKTVHRHHSHTLRPGLWQWLGWLSLVCWLPGCGAVSLAGSAAGAAISVTGSVVSAGVDVTGKVVGGVVDAALPSK
jgi:hypothetical protein